MKGIEDGEVDGGRGRRALEVMAKEGGCGKAVVGVERASGDGRGGGGVGTAEESGNGLDGGFRELDEVFES